MQSSITENKRTIAYIDGLNLYHALHDLIRPHLKWLNLWGLCESLLRDEDKLNAVNYYTAYATWIPGAYHRHLAYVRALKAVGVNIVLGQFKDKRIKCQKCGQRFKTEAGPDVLPAWRHRCVFWFVACSSFPCPANLQWRPL